MTSTELPRPKINSVPVYMSDSDETVEEKNTGFRFMGQRFTIDASIFGKENPVNYRKVGVSISDTESTEFVIDKGSVTDSRNTCREVYGFAITNPVEGIIRDSSYINIANFL